MSEKTARKTASHVIILASATFVAIALVLLFVSNGVQRRLSESLRDEPGAGEPANVPEGPLPPTAGIAGDWTSNYGDVTFTHTPVNDELDPVEVKGSWEPGEGTVGTITGGTFDPKTGEVELAYTNPDGPKGTASLSLSVDGIRLTGKWVQPGARGDWILVRKPGAAD